MAYLSSQCRCGAGGLPKHEMGKCPHLYHACTLEACGPYYSTAIKTGYYAGMPNVKNPAAPPPSVDTRPVVAATQQPTVQQGVYRPKPPWER